MRIPQSPQAVEGIYYGIKFFIWQRIGNEVKLDRNIRVNKYGGIESGNDNQIDWTVYKILKQNGDLDFDIEPYLDKLHPETIKIHDEFKKAYEAITKPKRET